MRVLFFVPLALALLISGCWSRATTDYSREENWSIQSDRLSHPIDVFFVHPTTYGMEQGEGKPITSSLVDAELNASTDRTIQQFIAAFSENCNVFAPRYRQMNIRALSMSDADREEYQATAARDVRAAFIYYLEQLNGGRPFMLAGHSQGSLMLKDLLLNSPERVDQQKLVAAYLAGYTFTADELDTMGLKLSESANQTGALITWNTIAENGSSPTLLPGAVCVNPLSWNSGKEKVLATEHEGARICLADGDFIKIPHFTSSRINEKGGLEVRVDDVSVAEQLYMPLGSTCYHFYDYDFFFENIKENVGIRCAAWQE